MKLEITKEFSTVYMDDRFKVYIDGNFDQSFSNFEEAQNRVKEIKVAIAKARPIEVLYTEDF